jgi:hypothetical protein
MRPALHHGAGRSPFWVTVDGGDRFHDDEVPYHHFRLMH